MIIILASLIFTFVVCAYALKRNLACIFTVMTMPYTVPPLLVQGYFGDVFGYETIAALSIIGPLTLVSLLVCEQTAYVAVSRALRPTPSEHHHHLWAALGAFFLLLLLLYAQYGASVFRTKVEADLGGLGGSKLFILFYGLGCVSVALSVALRTPQMLLITFAVAGVFLATGDRTHPFIILMFMCVVLLNRTAFRFATRALFAGSLSCLVFLFGVYGKHAYSTWATTGEISLFGPSAADGMSGIARSLQSSEPVFIWKTFEYTIGLDLRLDGNMLLDVLVFMPINFFVDADTMHGFSSVVKTHVYGDWSSSIGVGSNWLAEGFARGGYMGVLLYLLIYVGVPIIFMGIMNNGRFNAKVGLFMIVMWYTYIWRNGLGSILSHEKKVFWSYVAIWLSLYLVTFVWRGRGHSRPLPNYNLRNSGEFARAMNRTSIPNRKHVRVSRDG